MAEKKQEDGWGIGEDALNAAASIADPEMGEFTEKMVAGLPADSIFLKPIVGRMLGVANSFIESLSKRSKSKLVKVLGEKSTDYIDFFREAARKRTGGEGPEKSRAWSSQDWMKKFFEEAGERIKKSPTPKLTALDIEDEFRLRIALLKAMEQARKELEPAPPTPSEPIDWDAFYAKFKEIVGDFADGTVDAAKKFDNQLGPVADWLDKQHGARPMNATNPAGTGNAGGQPPAAPAATPQQSQPGNGAAQVVPGLGTAQPSANETGDWVWLSEQNGGSTGGGTTPPGPTPPTPPTESGNGTSTAQPPSQQPPLHFATAAGPTYAFAYAGGGAMPPWGMPPQGGAGNGGAPPAGNNGGGAGASGPQAAAGGASNTRRTLVNLWGVGNFWLRVAILIVASWPVFAAFAAFSASPAFTAAVALLPLFAGVLVLLLAFDPLFLAALGTFGFGRSVLAVLGTIIGAELAIGVFFSLVPFGRDPQLVIPALLVMAALAFFFVSGVKGRVVTVLMMVLMGITAVLFLGGRGEVERKLSSFAQASATAPGVQRYAAGEQDEVEIRIPPRFWGNVCTDKQVFVRVDGGNFRLDPPCQVMARDAAGNWNAAATMGDNTSGLLYVKAVPGQKMAQVTVSSVWK